MEFNQETTLRKDIACNIFGRYGFQQFQNGTFISLTAFVIDKQNLLDIL